MQDPTIGRTESDQSSQDILESLRALSCDLDFFASGWSERLNRAIECSRPVPLDDLGLRKRSEELQLEKQQWELERAAEQLLAKERIEQLTQAWLHLESEQRALLQNQASQHGSNSTAADVNLSPMNQSNTQSASISLSKSIAPVNTLSSNPSRNRDHTAQQFKQLRHEIDSRRSSNRQK